MITAVLLPFTESCKWNNSVIFAVFDFEEYGLIGSKEFLKNYTKYTTKSDFLGAIILDTILNYNKENKSQTLPPGIETAALFVDSIQDIINQLTANQYRGDGLIVIGRQLDKEIINEFSSGMQNASEYTKNTLEKMCFLHNMLFA